jgi:amidase
MSQFKQYSTWQETAKQMQDHREATLGAIEPKLSNVPTELPLNVTRIPDQVLSLREIEITTSAPELLLDDLATGKLRSVEVTNAFLRRAALAQKLVGVVECICQ